MEATWTKLLSSTPRFFLLVMLFFWRCSIFSYGQLINTTPLTGSEVAYTKDAAPSLEMHNMTSQSLVLFGRPLSPELQTPREQVAFSSGFFIMTDPALPHYCFLTAGHSLYDGENVDVSNDEMTLNMAFRITYANSVSNPTTYESVAGVPSGRPVSVTVASAEYRGGYGVTNGIDYGIVKISKLDLDGIPFVQHGIEFLDDKDKGLPTDRLSNESMKSVYSVHHANHRPQQISTLKKSAFIPPTFPGDEDYWKKPPVYLNMYAMPNWTGITYGSSGAPLVLPTGKQYQYAPAIGIVSKLGPIRNRPTPPQTDRAFQKLVTIKALLETHCLGTMKKNEYIKSKPIASFLGKIIKAIAQLKDIVVEIASIHKAVAEDHLTLVKGGQDELDAQSVNCQQKINDLIEMINQENSTEVQFLKAYDGVATNMTAYLSQVTEITRSNYTVPLDPDYFSDHLLESISSFRSEGSSQSFFSVHPMDMPHGPQVLATEIKTNMELVGKAFGHPFVTSRARRGVITDQMQAPEELVDLRSKVLELVIELNNLDKTSKEYKSDNKDFFRGLELFYLDQDEYSNLFLMDHFYQDEYAMTKLILKKMGQDLKKAQSVASLKIFSTEFATKLTAVNNLLVKLKAKKYPSGFITIAETKPKFELSYQNFTDPNIWDNIYKSPKNLSWRDLDIKLSKAAFPDDYLDVKHSASIVHSMKEGKVEGDGHFIKKSQGHWYATRLRMTGTMDLGKITHNYHPYFQQYLNRNSITLLRKGSMGYNNSTSNITYYNLFDREKLPANGSDFIPGFDRINYVKSLSDRPILSQNLSTGTVKYVLETPEMLILARAFKMVNKYKIQNIKTIEDEVMQGMEELGGNLTSMRTWAEASLQVTYRVEINGHIGWNYTLPVANTEAVTKGRLAVGATVQPEETEENGIPVLYPNPASDQLKLQLPEGYEQSEITVSTATGAKMNLSMQNQGHERIIDVRSLQTGLYFIQVQAPNRPKQVLKFLKK